jgi:hypothetical protein
MEAMIRFVGAYRDDHGVEPICRVLDAPANDTAGVGVDDERYIDEADPSRRRSKNPIPIRLRLSQSWLGR